MILVHCLAAPIAATVEWLWLGTVLTRFQVLCITVILAGVALALAPGRHLQLSRKMLWRGVAFGLVAALCQAGGALLSRKAYAVDALAHESIDGISAAYQRIWGGLPVALIMFWLSRLKNPEMKKPFFRRMRGGWRWLLLNATAGPALGVSCFQWALATTPAGIVLPIVALTPIVIIPFAIALEGEKPSVRSLAGGIIAVAGVVALQMSISRTP
jgi:drug/metabolite transporter (DMT)-like permease